MFREIMRHSKPRLERMPSTCSTASLKELRRRVSIESMAAGDSNNDQNLEYEVTLVSKCVSLLFYELDVKCY